MRLVALSTFCLLASVCAEDEFADHPATAASRAAAAAAAASAGSGVSVAAVGGAAAGREKYRLGAEHVPTLVVQLCTS